MSTYFISDIIKNQSPCSNCQEPVEREFSIPNPIWNKIVRKDGKEHDKEYLCIWCFTELVIEFLTEDKS